MSELGERILELHHEGYAASSIAHRLNVAQSTVHYHLRQALAPACDPDQPLRPRSGAQSHVETRERVEQLLAEHMSRAEIARRLGVSKSTVSYHARRLGETVDGRCARRYDWDTVQAFYDDGNSVRDCIREFGFSSQTWHAAVRRGAITPRPAYMPDEQVFAVGVPRNRGHLKRRLLLLGVRTGQCQRCGIHDWHDAPLTMTLHHVNGDRHDNRLENLQLLCPNCHSQTDNYAGRNRPPRSDTA